MVDRTPLRRIWRQLSRAVVAGATVGAGFAAVRPDRDAAISFGVDLQKDYAARQTRALIEHLDSDALMERVYSSRIKDDPDYARLRNQWEKEVVPSFARQLEAFDQFSVLAACRVIRDDDARELECLASNPEGVVQLVTLRLIESPRGEVRIADLQFGGARLTLARTVRHTLLLQRVPLPMVREAEEIDLQDFGKTYGQTIALALAALGQKDSDLAFKYWSDVSPAMKATRIWRELRDRMALLGCGPAMRELEHDSRDGAAVDPFLRFALASRVNDRARLLAALDGVLAAQHQLAFFRCAKADLLLQGGRTREALELARDIIDLDPLTVAAYITGVRAAVDSNQPAVALDLVRRWANVTPPPDIDRNLNAFPALAKFRASADYAAWQRPAPAEPAISAPVRH